MKKIKVNLPIEVYQDLREITLKKHISLNDAICLMVSKAIKKDQILGHG